jgi:hypothetical protein
MFGFDPLFMAAGDAPIYRHLRLSWGNSSGWGANVGFRNVRFYVGDVPYPPPLTANTSPFPYTVSASNAYPDPGYEPWRAFDGSVSTDFAQAGNGAGWLQLDFGEGFGISPSRVDLHYRNSGEGPASPITLLGSNDGTNFVTLATFTFSSWDSNNKTFYTGLAPASYAVKSVVTSQAVTPQSYTATADVKALLFENWGAGGGRAATTMSAYHGGPGGYITALVPVQAGDNITYAAGGRGLNYNEGLTGGTSGYGQGNGGNSGAGNGAGSGGGRTEVYRNGALILVAPGGGGGGGSDGYGGMGGPGGGLIGGDSPDANGVTGAKGGTQSAPGAGSTNGNATAGNGGIGGKGADGGSNRAGGGGGGGYQGGGGGGYQPAGQATGGAGGSAFASPTATQRVETAMGSGVTPPKINRGNWMGNAGYAGGPSTSPAYGLVSFGIVG